MDDYDCGCKERVEELAEEIRMLEGKVQTNTVERKENKDRLDYIEYESDGVFENSKQYLLWKRLTNSVATNIFRRERIVSVDDSGCGCRFDFEVDSEDTVSQMLSFCENHVIQEGSFEDDGKNYIVKIDVFK